MPKPACVKCKLFFKPKKTGIWVMEGMPTEYYGWKDYKLWRADLYECAGCGAEMVTGWAREPVTEHYMPNFDELRYLAEFRIDDC